MVQLVTELPTWVWLVAALLLLVVIVRAAGRSGVRKDPIRAYPAQMRHAGASRAKQQCEYSTPWMSRCSRSAEHADHFFPHSRGGATSMQNLVASCATHNLSKGAKMPSAGTRMLIQWRRRKYFPPTIDKTVGQWFR